MLSLNAQYSVTEEIIMFQKRFAQRLQAIGKSSIQSPVASRLLLFSDFAF